MSMWYSDAEQLQCLLNQKIVSLEIDETSTYLRFTTDQGNQFFFEAEGDCCSESWFQYITGVMFLIGATVNRVQEVEMDDTIQYIDEDEDNDDWDNPNSCIQLYKFCLYTDKGIVDFEYRNESNGYYGGNITRIDSLPEHCQMSFVTSDYVWNDSV